MASLEVVGGCRVPHGHLVLRADLSAFASLDEVRRETFASVLNPLHSRRQKNVEHPREDRKNAHGDDPQFQWSCNGGRSRCVLDR